MDNFKNRIAELTDNIALLESRIEHGGGDPVHVREGMAVRLTRLMDRRHRLRRQQEMARQKRMRDGAYDTDAVIDATIDRMAPQLVGFGG